MLFKKMGVDRFLIGFCAKTAVTAPTKGSAFGAVPSLSLCRALAGAAAAALPRAPAPPLPSSSLAI